MDWYLEHWIIVGCLVFLLVFVFCAASDIKKLKEQARYGLSRLFLRS